VRIDPDAAAAIVAQNLWSPNGMMTPDGTLIVAETFATPLTGGATGAHRAARHVRPPSPLPPGSSGRVFLDQDPLVATVGQGLTAR